MGNGNNEQTPGGSQDIVKSVETSFSIIDAIKDLEERTATEIAAQTGLSNGAVYKHLATLEKHGFVVKNGSHYNLGFRFLDYGGWLRSRYLGAEIIKPQIQALAEETNEVALFTIHEQGRVVTLFRENGNQGVFTRTRLGRRLYLHQTAGGKAILSCLPESDVRTLVDRVGLPKATDNTITTEAKLLEELQTVRNRGFARNDEESTEGLKAIAVPLVPNDTVIGACSIAGPRHRMGDDRIQGTISDLLLSAVNELELNIAHSQQSTSPTSVR